MNALARSTINRAILPRARQQMRMRSDLPVKSESYAKAWGSDPSTYPIVVIMAGAIVGCSGFIFYKFTFCNDVRVTTARKNSVLRI